MLKTLRLFLIITLLSLSGCQTFKEVEPNQYTVLGNLEINPQLKWSQYNSTEKSIKILTRDGVRLNVVSVVNVKDDEHIYKQRLTEQNKGYKFDDSMSLADAAELYLDGLNASNVFNPEILDESLTLVSGEQAIRFEYTYDTESGLTYHHMTLFIKHDGQLDILNCYGPEEYYFPSLKSEFETIIASAKIAE